MTTCKSCLHAGRRRLYCQWEHQDSWHSQMSWCGPFQYPVCRSAAQPADVRSCRVQLLQSFRDSGTVRYNPASGEVLGCTVLKLASFHLSVLCTTVWHQRTVCGQSRTNWLRWQQVICTRWITATQEQSLGKLRIRSQFWATFLSNMHELCSANSVWRNPVQRWSRYTKGIAETAKQGAYVNSIKCSCKIKLNEQSSESIVGCAVHVVQQYQQRCL